MGLNLLQEPDDRYLDFKEVASALKISESHLRRLIHDRKFPAGIRLGDTDALLWLRRDVDSFVHLSMRLAQPPPEPRRKKSKDEK